MPHVGEVIRSLRQAAGRSQGELAQEVGVSSSLLSLIESGKREPTIKTLRQIAEKLGLPSAVLFAAALTDDAHPSSAKLIEQLVNAARMQLLEESLMEPLSSKPQKPPATREVKRGIRKRGSGDSPDS